MDPTKEPRQCFVEDPLHVLHGLHGILHGTPTPVDLPMTLKQGFYSPNVVEFAIRCNNYLPNTNVNAYVRWSPNSQRLAVGFNSSIFSPAQERVPLARLFMSKTPSTSIAAGPGRPSVVSRAASRACSS